MLSLLFILLCALFANASNENSAHIQENEALSFEKGIKRSNRKHEMSDSEIMTILMLYHFGSFKNYSHLLIEFSDVYRS